jgi:hypothetical protein
MWYDNYIITEWEMVDKMTTLNFKLPMDDAWEKAVFHIQQDDMGSVVVPVKMGEQLVLIASNGLKGVSTISAAVEIEHTVVGQLEKPAAYFHLSEKRYIGIPVANVKQAGGVLHVLSDAIRKEVSVLTAANYVAKKIREFQ